MSAAAIAQRPAAAAPAQLALEGLPAPQLACRVAIVGHLQRRGELRVSTDGRAHVVVQVLQPRDGLAFVAMFHEHEGASRADLERLAAHMHAGTAVVVIGHGLQLEHTHGDQPHLRVLRCTGLCLADVARFFPETGLAPTTAPEHV